MSRTLFKFSKPPDGLTRRVLFVQRPAWPELSAKIESLYAIPKDNVGVSYVDSDGDEITLSSDEELKDFYRFNIPEQGFGQRGDTWKAIRFTVRDLSSVRASEGDKPRSEAAEDPHYRNTFGFNSLVSGGLEGDDWQHVSAFGGPQASIFVPIVPEDSPAPHAFLEVVESDASMSRGPGADDASSVTQSDYDATPKVDKGKARATVESSSDDDDIASTVAMVEEDAPRKPPVHVRDASRPSIDDIFGINKTVPPTMPTVVHDDAAMAEDPKENTAETPDPPLPDLGEMPSTTNPTASLANDIAGLLNTFSTVFATHPELSEGMRNIIRNATQGTYWSAHREAMTKAAEEMRRSAQQSAGSIQRSAEEMHRAAEEAAGRRVAEAIGGIMRAFGQYTGTTSAPDSAASADGAQTTTTPSNTRTAGLRGERGRRRPYSPSRRETWHFETPHDSPTGPPPSHLASLDPHTFNLPPWVPQPPHFASNFHDGPVHAFRAPPPPPFFGGIPPPPPVPPVQSTPTGPSHNFAPAPPFMPFGQAAHSLPPPPPVGMFHHYRPPMPPMTPTAPPPPPPPQAEPADLLLPTVDMPIDTLEHDVDGASTPSSAPSTPKEAETSLPGHRHSLPAGFIPGQSGVAREKFEDHTQPDESYAFTKENLQKAKEAYRKEKEKYRKERATRRADRLRRANTSGDGPTSGDDAKNKAAPSAESPSQARITPDPQLVSNARGTFPRIELESVSPASPRRHHTLHGMSGWSHGRHHHHHGSLPPPFGRPSPNPHMHNPFMTPRDMPRAVTNITRRLTDMGFTSETYPELPAKILARGQRIKDDTSREAEDAAVADVVEELLAKPASAAIPSANETRSAASGSVSKNSETSLPGGWL